MLILKLLIFMQNPLLELLSIDLDIILKSQQMNT